MQYKENEEIKGLNKEIIMDQLSEVMQSMSIVRDYLDQLDVNYHDTDDSKHLFRLYGALFCHDSVNHMVNIANSSLKSVDDAYFYLANLDKLYKENQE